MTPNFKTFIAIVAFIVLFTMLQGCTQYDTYSTLGAQKAAQTTDELLEAKIWAICEASTIGSVRRHFNTKDSAATYNEFCNSQSGQDFKLEPKK
jgi:hypothetical protein